MRDEQGGVAVLFAVCFIPIMAVVAASVDYSRANRAMVQLQAATDSAALALAKEAKTVPSSQLQPDAAAFVQAGVYNPDITNLIVLASYDSTAQTVSLEAYGPFGLTLMKA